MMETKQFKVVLKVVKHKTGDYEVAFDALRMMENNQITAVEMDAIFEGCQKMSKTLTERVTQQIFSDADPGVL